MKRFLFSFTCAVLMAGQALACPVLTSADPKVGGTAPVGTDHLDLTFSDAVVTDQSSIIVKNAQGKEMQLGKAYGKDEALSTKLAPLPAGVYKVTWQVLCDCGNPMPGHFKFTVR